jgi:hypothetical protein
MTDDIIKSPNHYKGRTGFEAKEIIWEFNLGFCLGNAVKYIVRAGKKPGNSERQDLMKARENINMRLEELDAEDALREGAAGGPVVVDGKAIASALVRTLDWKHTKP